MPSETHRTRYSESAPGSPWKCHVCYRRQTPVNIHGVSSPGGEQPGACALVTRSRLGQQLTLAEDRWSVAISVPGGSEQRRGLSGRHTESHRACAGDASRGHEAGQEGPRSGREAGVTSRVGLGDTMLREGGQPRSTHTVWSWGRPRIGKPRDSSGRGATRPGRGGLRRGTGLC